MQSNGKYKWRLLSCLLIFLGSQDTLQKQTSAVSIVSLGEFKARPLDYVPDFTVKAKTDLQYIRIRRSDYIAARHATLLERKKNSTHGGSDDHFDEYRSRTQIALTPDQTRSDTDSLRDDLSPRDVNDKGFADRSHHKEDSAPQTRSPKRVNSDSSESHHASLEIPLIGSSLGLSPRAVNISWLALFCPFFGPVFLVLVSSGLLSFVFQAFTRFTDVSRMNIVSCTWCDDGVLVPWSFFSSEFSEGFWASFG